MLTAFQNAVHTLEDAEPGHPLLAEAQRLMLCAETSCYWYWTGQHVWDQQVTNAANLGWSRIRPSIEGLLAAGRDATPPTMFAPWWRRKIPAARSEAGAAGGCSARGTVHTFVADVAGVTEVSLVIRSGGRETRLAMTNRGPYPSQTGAAVTAGYYTRGAAGGRRRSPLHRSGGWPRQPGAEYAERIRYGLSSRRLSKNCRPAKPGRNGVDCLSRGALRRTRPPFLVAVGRGLSGRCPNCGEGRLFRAYLKQVDACAVCGEPWGHIRADDAPPWLTILIVGHIVVPAAMAVESEGLLPFLGLDALWRWHVAPVAADPAARQRRLRRAPAVLLRPGSEP
ncbi:MAG: DUF983 domain-containing protein [Rhodospirillales bacterium]